MPEGTSPKGKLVIRELPEMIVTQGEGIRRLPAYLLLDTSGSMAGAPIEALRRGVEQFKRETEEDIYCKETLYVGIITFGGEADFITRGLVPIEQFKIPTLNANGQTPLGQALWLLQESLDKDVKPGIPGGEKGDWKPLVFILTDGMPTDEWREPRDAISQRQGKKVVNVITVGCGPGINQQNLKDIAIGPTFNMDMDGASFKAFFKWVTQSVIATSRAVSKGGSSDKPPLQLPPPPGPIQYIP